MAAASNNLLPTSICPCQSGLPYGTCCGPYLQGQAKPETAEQLMRSRFSAYVLGIIDYLVATTHPTHRHRDLARLYNETAASCTWLGLTILKTSGGQKKDQTGKVEFQAIYQQGGAPGMHHEHSRFKRHKGAWMYLDASG